MRADAPRLTATYRVQLNADFTFVNAREIVPYLEKLGISHLYCAPIFMPRRGSTHGYDVADPTRVNAALGGESELRALAGELHRRSMGLIVDIVPNHMGIGDENPFWDDVLARGKRSRFAHWFDIDWTTRAGVGGHRIVLPVLATELDESIRCGEIAIRLDDRGSLRMVYREHSFPIDPVTVPPELQLAQLDPAAANDAISLFSAADADGCERLNALLVAQHYRLAPWSGTSPNYRRFFDVNNLVTLRMHDPQVFEETHAQLFRLVEGGVIDGVRVDHVDGLRDPGDYLMRLRERIDDRPIFVEKILAADEQLRTSWPVQGTTGYDVLTEIDDLFIDPAGAAEIEGSYRRLRRLSDVTFRSVARESKASILRTVLHAEVERLVSTLLPLARDSGTSANATELGDAIIELIAALPVYRTYIDATGQVHPDDRIVIERAAGDVIARHITGSDIARFVADVLLGRIAGDHAARLSFVSQFQQLSGPAAAKGIEDTALYSYSPMIARNEVGGNPARALTSAVRRLHESNARRAEQWPLSLTCTSTHDTKRSGDVRSRIAALSELPREWNRAVRRWRRLNAKHRVTVSGRLAPDTNTEYLLYQTLIALWPTPRHGRRVDDLPERAWRDGLRQRLVEYMLKAVREAKTSTSWLQPNATYENALHEFTTKILEPAVDAPFLPDVARVVSMLAPAGALNALSRIALHLTAPGTPDIYQGDEFWNFTLVDPDNRRAVDYGARQEALNELPDYEHAIVDGTPMDFSDNRLKLLITSKLLTARRSHADLFARGNYRPLGVRGPRADHLFAHGRELGERAAIVVVPRLSCRLAENLDGCWLDTVIELPQSVWGRQLRSVLTARSILADERGLPAEIVFEQLPVAVFMAE